MSDELTQSGHVPIAFLPTALRIAEKRRMTYPKTVDELSFRACRANFTSTNDFRWSFPGKWAKASGPFTKSSNPCPSVVGDGLCIARTWSGMASGGIPADLILLVGWSNKDVLADSIGKLRVKKAYVVDVFTIFDLIGESEGKGAYLKGANLEGAYLKGAYLEGAYNLDKAIR